MTFLNPLGLLGLIGLIALIIIYILKPKYQDKTISSTYIWKLSLKYHRTKSPFEWLKSSLLIILQILIITTIALLMAAPNYRLKTNSGEKIVVLDGSASMQVEENGISRFELAKREIIKLASSTTPNDMFTVIFLGEEVDYVVRRSNSLDYIRQYVTSLTPTYLSLDLSLTNNLVESVLRENPDSLVYLYTTKDINVPNNVTLVNMSNSNSWNAGIVNFNGNLQPNGYYMFQVEIHNYGAAKDIPVALYVDGSYISSKIVPFENNENVLVSFDNNLFLTYKNAEVIIDVEDDFMFDNSFTLFNRGNQRFEIQLYSENENPSTVYFLNSALNSLLGSIYINTVNDPSDLSTSGYDLYIYDSYTPSVLPIDGSVWFFNVDSLPNNIPITIGNEETGPNEYYLTGNASSSLAYQAIMKNINPTEIYVTKYKKITSYPNFENIMGVNSDPLILSQDYNDQKVVVFSFDLAYSNLPILIDFPFIIQNLFKFSTVSTLDSYQFKTGTQLTLKPRISAYQASLDYNEQKEIFVEFPIKYTFNDPGVYELTQSFLDKDTISENFYVHIPFNESYQTIEGSDYVLPLISEANTSNFDYIDILPYLALLLFGLFIVEWVVQYREQY